MKSLAIIKSESGVISLDYIFALVLVFGFMSIMLAFCLTLTVVEMTQYVTYSTARTYMASDIRLVDQINKATYKYQQLVNHPVFNPLYTNGWFEIEMEQPLIGDVSDTIPEYKTDNPELGSLFTGVATPFVAKVLDINIPFFGPTTDDKTRESAGGFATFIGSYLNREPSINECINLNRNRWKMIRDLNTKGVAPYSTNTQEEGVYVTISDNGC